MFKEIKRIIKGNCTKAETVMFYALLVLSVAAVAWAADTKLSALTNLGAAPATTDELYLNDAGTSKALTVANLMLYLGAAHDTSTELTNLFAAKEVQLDNEAGLYAVLSDVALFLEDLADDTTPSLGGNLAGADYTVLSTNTVRGAAQVTSSAGNITVSAAQMNGNLIVTAAGEVQIPDVCDAANGDWLKVINKTATNQVELAVVDTGNDKFVLVDGTALDVDDEVDLGTNASDSVKIECLEANIWYITAQVGVATDGGAAD